MWKTKCPTGPNESLSVSVKVWPLNVTKLLLLLLQLHPQHHGGWLLQSSAVLNDENARQPSTPGVLEMEQTTTSV
jgi:hypothetical protein